MGGLGKRMVEGVMKTQMNQGTLLLNYKINGMQEHRELIKTEVTNIKMYSLNPLYLCRFLCCRICGRLLSAMENT